MKKYENPEFKVLELAANDVLNGSGPDINALFDPNGTPAVSIWP